MNDFDELKDQWREEMSGRRANGLDTMSFDDWVMVHEARAMLWDELDNEL